MNTFRTLQSVLSGEIISISQVELQSLISLCDVLENWRLKRLFVGLSFDISKSTSKTLIVDFSTKTASNLSEIASELYSYSIEDLSLFDSETLCEILSNEKVVLQNDLSLFELIVRLGSNYYCLFDYLRFGYLHVSNISRFIKLIDISEVSSKMWSGLCHRLKSVSTFPLDTTRHHINPIESAIVSTLPRSFWKGHLKRFSLPLRGSRAGFSTSASHEKCDGRNHTITIVSTTTGCILGGYTPCDWSSDGGYKRDD
jgi:hypothetical protein